MPGSRQHGRGQAPPLRGHAPTGRRGECLVGATLVVARAGQTNTQITSTRAGTSPAPTRARSDRPTGGMPRRGDPCGRPCLPNQMPGSRQHGRGQAPPLRGHAPTGRRGECLVGATLVVARAGQTNARITSTRAGTSPAATRARSDRPTGGMPRRGDPCGRPSRPNQRPDHINAGGASPPLRGRERTQQSRFAQGFLGDSCFGEEPGVRHMASVSKATMLRVSRLNSRATNQTDRPGRRYFSA